ncbi:PglZ domain protein [Clostridium ragsdalei P11]|uniref:PglZ domain protein n=1 Tax=Clostridium ragsdalei P11 TaxID=1353534 RepID=A0A1A6ANC9_9CLOT|nr:BREX-1 system phosphatase PglZ type A [Clostridium ragsdalei]OBR91571.1 PglZ domain protein [Clostridium ragsdalei P11]
MNLKEIKNVLTETFNKELDCGKKRHIVFWYDEEGEFAEDIDELSPDNVRGLKLTENNSYAIKYEIEKVDKVSHFLIYANMQKPSPRENYLLDILKYSTEFSTDKTTAIMRELGVKDDSLKGVFKRYLKFFNNKERYASFTKYEIENYTEEKIDIAVLSVLCKLDVCDIESVIKALFAEELKDNNKYLEAIEKFGDVKAFWRLVEKYYGFNLEDRNLEKLILFFMVTNLSYTLDEAIPRTWGKYVSSKKSDCIVFMSHFMSHSVDSKIYDALSNKFEDKLNIQLYIKEWDIDNYIKCDVFKAFDKAIISKLVEQLLDDIGEYDKYTEIISARRTTHFFNDFAQKYEAINAAVELFKVKKNIGEFIRQYKVQEFFEKYTNEYYVIDKAYRRFYAAFDKLEDKEALVELREKVENTYVNWFVDELSVKWSNAISDELQDNWNIPLITQQKDFYNAFIKQHVIKGERVFVVVSDALRYESAKEFSDILNIERKGFTEIYAMQGVIPSYTKLGMASLLPNDKIQIDDKTEIIVDGINSAGTDNREKVLLKYSENSVAIQYKDLIEMSRSEFRKTFNGKKLIYIYHNSIDAVGDHAATEREVFNAVDETFKELKTLINDLINNVSASNIYITSDHGFIYKRGLITESDKTSKNVEDAAVEKRRFIISDKKQDMEGTICFSMDYILGKDSGKYVTVPRGSNRFKVQGEGANFVHGGATLQEIVVPVIKFKNDRSKNGKSDTKKVEVKLTNISRKITSVITYLEFFQTEKVEDKKIPVRLKIYFTDEEGNRISNENIIIADSKSTKPEDRSYKEKFTLKSMPYDKKKKYYLIMEDEEEAVENIYEKILFIIDIAISDDFGF